MGIALKPLSFINSTELKSDVLPGGLDVFLCNSSMSWLVLEPGLAHISRTTCSGFTSSKRGGIWLTSSCRTKLPQSASDRRNK